MAKKNTKKNTKKEDNKKSVVVPVKKKDTGKTDLVLTMVEKGKTRKEILDVLCKLDLDISRKSNAGLVSHIFKSHDLLGKVESGVEKAKKKEIVVKAAKVKNKVATAPKAKTAKKTKKVKAA